MVNQQKWSLQRQGGMGRRGETGYAFFNVSLLNLLLYLYRVFKKKINIYIHMTQEGQKQARLNESLRAIYTC